MIISGVDKLAAASSANAKKFCSSTDAYVATGSMFCQARKDYTMSHEALFVVMMGEHRDHIPSICSVGGHC